MENEEKTLKLNQESMDLLVTNIIPTSKYFEVRFDSLEQKFDNKFEYLQLQIDELKAGQKNLREDMDEKFADIKLRFKEVDKRFEQVDANFKEVNKNILDLTVQIQKLAKSNETTVRDYIIERDRHYDNKFNNMRNFNLAVITLVAGVILKMAGIINI